MMATDKIEVIRGVDSHKMGCFKWLHMDYQRLMVMLLAIYEQLKSCFRRSYNVPAYLVTMVCCDHLLNYNSPKLTIQRAFNLGQKKVWPLGANNHYASVNKPAAFC